MSQLSAFAAAPEGGVVELTVSLAKPREADTQFAWAIAADNDPATADADAEDYGDASGAIVIPAGETNGAISIPIADDSDIEPAREVFVVSLEPQEDVGLGVASATVHVEEGVCDRTTQVADALRGMRDCAAVTSTELERRVSVRLDDAGLATLHPRDFLGMAGMTTLFLERNGLHELPSALLSHSPRLAVLRLRGNRFEEVPSEALRGLPALRALDMGDNLLRELPETLLPDSPALRYLYLDGNQLEALPAGLVAGSRNLLVLEVQDNAIDVLPAGFFAGVGRLWKLQLHDNPGAPFTLELGLARPDAEDTDAEDPVAVALSAPQGAPFDMAVRLTVEGGALPSDTATIAAGQTSGMPVPVTQGEAGGSVSVAIESAPSLPETVCGDYGVFNGYPCFRGLEVSVRGPVTLFGETEVVGGMMAVPTLRR